MPTVANLSVSLTARIGSFEKGFKKAQKLIDKHSQGTQAAARFATKWGAALVTAAAVGSAAIVKSQLNTVGALNDASLAIGFQVEQFQALIYIGKKVGISADAMAANVEKLATNLSDLDPASGVGAELKAIGVDLAAIGQMTPGKQLQTLAAAFERVETAGKKAALAKDIFGKSGVGMVNVLRDLNENGLKPATERLTKMQALITGVDVARIDAAGDAFTDLGTLISGVGAKLTSEISPALEGVVNGFIDAAISSDHFAGAVSTSFDWVVKGIGWIANGLQGLRIGFNVLQQAVNYFGLAFNKIFEWINAGLGKLFDAIYGNLNWLYTQLNKVLPESMEIALNRGDNYFTRAAKVWENGADYFLKALDANQQEISKLMAAPWSSGNIDAWVSKVEELAQKRAELQAKANDALTGGSGGGAGAAARTAEFREVDLSTVYIGKGAGGSGASQITKGETAIVEEQKKTNAILWTISRKPVIT
jgi:hypothetical protein